MPIARKRWLPAATLLLLAALAAAFALAVGKTQRAPVGLFSSLPILWAESATIADLLKQPARLHWAKAALDARGGIVALDSLARLEGIATLVMAQPRPLAPGENVALDNWVRGGGRVLLFADPMLTAPSAFALGDRRRPQDVVLLSPILARWGLRLEFDDGQAFGQHGVGLYGTEIPVNLPGRFVAIDPAGTCSLVAGGLAAECRIGKGRLIALADAALLEGGEANGETARRAALDELLDRLESDD